MTIIQDLERLLHEHQELTAMVSGTLLAKDLRDLVNRHKAQEASIESRSNDLALQMYAKE